MGLRCKPGDLAVVIFSEYLAPLPLGAIVRCLEATFVFGRDCMGPGWYLEFRGSQICPLDGSRWCCFDSHLKPIRPDEGEDEVLRIAGKPEKVSA